MSKMLVAPLEALTDPRLSDPERRVLLALFSFRGRDTNTVFPSLASLGERSNIRDITRVSKLTTALAGKGWLTKKKRGFTGSNQYALSVPEHFDQPEEECKSGLMDEPSTSKIKSDKVYIVTDGGSFKIGITTMPMVKRLGSLQTSCPATLEVVCCSEIPCARNVELELSEKLAEKQVSGEWFDLATADVLSAVGLLESRCAGRFYSNLDLLAKLAQGAKLGGTANSNLDYGTNSNLDQKAKYKEQTTEQTKEQTNSCVPFDDFWAIYPKKVKRDKAKTKWGKLKVTEDLFNLIAENIKARLAAGDWKLSEKQYIPAAEVYLNGKRWEDEIIPQGGNPNAKHQPNYRKSLSERSAEETAAVLADIEAREAGDGPMGSHDPALWPQVGQSGGAD